MADITGSLFCEVHGEVTVHCLLAENRWECMEALPTGYCGETRDGATPEQDAYGQERAGACTNCGAWPSRQPNPACPLCGHVEHPRCEVCDRIPRDGLLTHHDVTGVDYCGDCSHGYGG